MAEPPSPGQSARRAACLYRTRRPPATPPDPMASELLLKLFIAGDSPRAREAAANLRRAVQQLESGHARVETVDVLEHPELADEYRILTTPTVVREAPAPRRRVTGDLRDIAQVLAALSLFPHTSQP